VQAQSNKQKQIIITQDIVLLDSQIIDELSIQIWIDSTPLARNLDFILLAGNQSLKFNKKYMGKSALIKYHLISPYLFQTQTNNRLIRVGNASLSSTTGLAEQGNQATDVQSAGILSRGISFGNSQDLVLNSNLNLRLSGKISDKISIEGAITDQEFPFQPEGTTSTLQDFDRIYLKFYLPKSEIILGDHPFVNPAQFAFIKYNKKNRGLQWKFNSKGEKATHTAEVDAALARGRFARNEIAGQEGLQGPYRLSGTRNEQFIIIISGTENVYLDGKKMERGLQGDYTIDYNLGEVTFTPKNLISTFSRIVVEFQYSDRFYARTIGNASYMYQTKRLSTYIGIYSENDVKNQPIQQSLDLFDSTKMLNAREILAQAGDNFQSAGLNGARLQDEFNLNSPNYIKLDSAGNTYYLYVSTPDNNSQFYNLVFSYLGPSRGNYIVDGTGANGKVYRYVAPINGIPTGDYEPIVQVVAPNAIQMTEVGISYKIRPRTQISTQISGSRQDLNTFSSLDDADNLGWAGKMTLNHQQLSTDSNWTWAHSLTTDYSSKDFKTVERFRDIEFSRDWNRTLNNETQTLTQVYSAAYKSELKYKENFILRPKLAHYSVNNESINDAALAAELKVKNFYLQPSLQWNQNQKANRTFTYVKNTLGYKTKKVNHFINYQEERSITNLPTLAYSPNSYGFNAIGASTAYTVRKSTLGATYGRRVSMVPLLQSLAEANLANNYTGSYTNNRKYATYNYSISYRQSKLLDTQFKNQFATEDHLSSRFEINVFPKSGILRFNTFYQTISGREQQRQYAYFEVPAGQGYYAWQDYNGNGIREINEFEQSPFPDQARYVRLLIPTGQYIKSQGTELNGNLNLKKPEKEGTFDLSNTLTYNLNAKTLSNKILDKIIPYLNPIADISTLNAQYFTRNQTDFQSANRKWFVQQTLQSRKSKIFLTNGFDTRNSQETQTLIRVNLGSQWQAVQNTRYRQVSYISEFAPANSFQYQALMLSPALTWQPSIKFRIEGTLLYTTFTNPGSLGKQVETILGSAKSIGRGGQVDIEVSYIQNQFSGNPSSPLAFDILQGFTIGNNVRGTLNLRFNPSKNIQIVSGYETRKSQTSKWVHIGRAEVRYLF
jgi:hypothetical protein